QDISIDQVRTLVLARASFAPHEGRAKVFIVRRAEELSTSAANALLKTLEEPNKKTHFILLSSQPDSLLSTIRSRTQRVRFAALPQAIVTKLLIARGVDAFRAAGIARLSAGSMQGALSLADDEESAAREAFVTRALEATVAPTLGPALDLAEDAKKDKGELGTKLAALATALAGRASGGAAAPARGGPPPVGGEGQARPAGEVAAREFVGGRRLQPHDEGLLPDRLEPQDLGDRPG